MSLCHSEHFKIMLARVTTLLSLELIELDMNDAEVPALFGCFEACTQLTKLRLAHAHVRAHARLPDCATHSLPRFPHLRHLSLSGCALHHGGGSSIVEAICSAILSSYRAARAGVCSDSRAGVATDGMRASAWQSCVCEVYACGCTSLIDMGRDVRVRGRGASVGTRAAGWRARHVCSLRSCWRCFGHVNTYVHSGPAVHAVYIPVVAEGLRECSDV